LIMRWYYVASDKQQKGPIKEAEFIKLFQSNTITSDTLVWNGKTVQDWCKISTIEGIEDELKNWKPGCGDLLKSLGTSGKKKAKTNEQQQADVHDVEEKPNTQENAKGQQAQTSQAVQTTEDKGLKSDGPQKVINVEDDSPAEGIETNETGAPKAIIQANADRLEEKESRLSKKVEVAELKEKMEVEKVETNDRPQVLEKEKEELKNVVKAQEEKEPSAPSKQTTVKNLEEKLRAKIKALEDSSGKSASEWEKLSRENDSLQKKNVALTEENRIYKDKMNSRVAELESQLSKAVNESKVEKENLETQSETKAEWANLEKEQNILKEKVKALNEEKSKFEKFKSEELVRMKSLGQVAGNTSKVDVAQGQSSIVYRWRWTLLSIGLVSVVGYKMLTRVAEPEPKVQSSLYSAAGERGKKLSETITNKVTNTISSRLPDIPNIPNIPNIPSIPSVFKK